MPSFCWFLPQKPDEKNSQNENGQQERVSKKRSHWSPRRRATPPSPEGRHHTCRDLLLTAAGFVVEPRGHEEALLGRRRRQRPLVRRKDGDHQGRELALDLLMKEGGQENTHESMQRDESESVNMWGPSTKWDVSIIDQYHSDTHNSSKTTTVFSRHKSVTYTWFILLYCAFFESTKYSSGRVLWSQIRICIKWVKNKSEHLKVV